MTRATTLTPTTPPTTSAAAVVLRRRRAVPVPAATGPAGTDPRTDAGVTLLETELLGLGYLLDAPLRAALAVLPADDLVAVAAPLLAAAADAVGADRVHTPLFARFPDDVPTDTLRLWVDRMLTVLLQQTDLPCVLCGAADAVRPVSPCAHLVCTHCFTAGTYTACPICYRKLDPEDPYLTAVPRPARRAAAPLPVRVTVLHAADADAETLLAAELRTLLARTTALSPADLDDLDALLATRNRDDLTFLPAAVGGREPKAHLLAWLLTEPTPATVAAAAALTDTATDVLRTIAVLSGHPAGLHDVGRLGPLPRPVRRALLAALEGCEPGNAAADVQRHARLWQHAFELLHPFEHAGRFPAAAALAGLVRGTRVTTATGPVATALTHATQADAPGLPGATVRRDRLTVDTPTALAERALAAGDPQTAAAALQSRPGELLRRADHLLRAAAPADLDAITARLLAAVPAASPAVLIATLGALRVRTAKAPARVFFPAGGTARTHLTEDTRPPLHPASVATITDAITAELLRRAAALPAAATAVVDTALAGVTAPFAERTASRALLTLPRGSLLPLPPVTDGRLRLFCHWMENPGQRVDLDLSVAFYDADWDHVGTCDYTTLGWARGIGLSGAIHSGDFTSAPAPAGATEFVDLDVASLRDAGARWAVVTVLSYNDVPFTELAEAFAGVMTWSGDPRAGAAFDPRAVEQRFDLTGAAKVALPMVLDLQSGTLRWLDVTAGVTGTHHAVHRYSNNLGALGAALTDLFDSGARVSLGALALIHAAGRADTVVLRRPDGTVRTLRRAAEETAVDFHARLVTAVTGGGFAADSCAAELAAAGLVFAVRPDAGAPDAAVYAALPGTMPGTATPIAGPDVAAALAPTAG